MDIADYYEDEYPDGTAFHKGDIRDRDAIDRILKEHKIDVIIHAAAALPLWKKKDIYDVNIGGTHNVLNAALDAGVSRVVFVCSTAVYGVPKKHPIDEDDPLVGVGAYGISKIEAEKVCREFREKGLCVPIVRPKTFLGTGRLGVFQILYDWVESGCRIPIIGNGKNRYQLLEVTDLVEAIYLTATADADKANDTFNIGAKEFKTVREDVGALCDFAGHGARPMPVPGWLVKPALKVFEAVKLSPLYKWVYATADRDSFVSTDRIENRLGWSPKYSNAQALIRAYEWYLNNKVESDASSGITHRVAWNQGVLKVFKTVLR
jgi:nucleoside-diphosphate-sugar epimerase